ncbi:MAG: acyltransferase [Candidatus Shapirobacteria bacterium]
MGIFRLLLAISVLIAHSTPIFGNTLVGGRVAVESFFMISGFYMALILTTKYKTNIKTFYKNRFLKLFPLYWFFTIAVIITSFITTGKFTIFKDYYITPFSKTILILFNSSPLFNDVSNFMGLNTTTGNLFFTPSFRDTVPEIWNYLILPQGWTIGLEIMFYMFAPWLVKQKNKTLIIVAALSLSARLLSYYFLHLNHDPWEYRFFPFEIIYFILGIFAYRIYLQLNLKLNIFYLIPVFLFTFLFPYIPFNTKRMLAYYFVVFVSIPFLFKYTKDNKIDRFLGELSYPLYLCHFLVIDIFAQIIKVNHVYLGLYSLLLSLPIAILSYNLINGIVKRD